MFIRRLPPLPELKRLFCADPDAGTLHWKVAGRGRKGVGTEAGAAGFKGRRSVLIAGVSYATSRILWALYTGRDPGSNYIDHINGDPSDNRKCNLRCVTPGENAINKKPYGATGHRGVYYARTLRNGEPRYKVNICRVVDRDQNGKHIRKMYNYGYFTDLNAAIARAAEVHEEWGMLDFIPSNDTTEKKAG